MSGTDPRRLSSTLGVGLAVAIVLSGCAVHTPRVDPAPSVELRPSFAETGIEAPEEWWEGFDDPGLAQVMDATLADNLSLRMAWSRLDQMQAVARAAGAARYPQVDARVGADRQKLGGDEPDSPLGPQLGTTNTVSASLSVGYQVDLWKKISNSRKAATVDLEASRQDLEATALALSGAAGELWFGIAAQQAALELLDAQLDVGEDFLRLVQLRFANGLTSAVAVLQQRLQVETTRNQIPEVTTRLANLKHQLAILLGREPRARTLLPGAELPPLPPLPSTGAPIEVLRARPDVRGAELRLVASDHRLAVAIADRYPSLSFSATAAGEGASFTGLLDTWLVNLAANLFAPIFDGGRRAAEADRNRAVVEERFYAWQAVLLSAAGEVEDALVTERGLKETHRILAAQLDLAEASLVRSRALYANGLTDYLTVLTSLQALQNLERQALSTKLQLINNRIRLHLALGGSWPDALTHPIRTAENHS